MLFKRNMKLTDQRTVALSTTECVALSNCLNHMLSETEEGEFSTLVGFTKDEAQDLMAKLQRELNG